LGASARSSHLGLFTADDEIERGRIPRCTKGHCSSDGWMVESALRIIIVMLTGESQRLLFPLPARISLYGLEVIVMRFVVLRSGSL